MGYHYTRPLLSVITDDFSMKQHACCSTGATFTGMTLVLQIYRVIKGNVTPCNVGLSWWCVLHLQVHLP